MTLPDLDLVDTEQLVHAIQRRMEIRGGFAVISLAFPAGTDRGDVFHAYVRSEASLAIAQALVRNIEECLRGEGHRGWEGIRDR